MSDPPVPFHWAAAYEPLLGTVVEVRVALDGTMVEGDGVRGTDGHGGADEDALDLALEARAEEIIESVIEEMLRLQSILSAVDRGSELARWSDGLLDHVPLSDELTEVLIAAHWWHARTDGRFNPASGVLSARWREAEVHGVDPTADELHALATTIAILPWNVDGRIVSRGGDCSRVNLNAFAKGWIVDRAVALVVSRFMVRSLSVNAGGDIRHIGGEPLLVGIENPLRPYDDEPPIAVISIRDRGIATSGSARRGVVVDGNRYGHVIDPRTGRAADAVASISVIADDAATADVLATAIGVLPPDEVLAEADRWGVACLVIDRSGEARHNDAWAAAMIDS